MADWQPIATAPNATPSDRAYLLQALAAEREKTVERCAALVEAIGAEYEREGFPGTHWKNVASAIRALSPKPDAAEVHPIVEGMREAVSYAAGDRSMGRSTVVRVEPEGGEGP